MKKKEQRNGPNKVKGKRQWNKRNKMKRNKMKKEEQGNGTE